MAEIVDTVGFVDQIPLDLYHCFLQTLEELRECSVILHVQDISVTDRNMVDAHQAFVYKTLLDVGICDPGMSGQTWRASFGFIRRHLVNKQFVLILELVLFTL